MASTYSPKLRFELIGAGEQAGLWGTTTNKNVGQLIEQAIAGVTTVDLTGLSGNYTLTALDGAPDQSRSAVITCIGTASAGINLIIPTQTKLYVIRNDCGQTITVKTSAQTGGVQLLNSEATLVFCDGTDAVVGIESAAAGTLPVSGGGTGSTTFTAGFIKSPGGTGALTSSATVALGSEVSGTLPVANGGTGVTSVTSGRIVLGNGSGPLTVLSGTVNGQVPVWNSSTSSWQAGTAGSGTVTSVSGTGTVSGLTLTGTVTTSGSLTLGGTLSLTSGNVTTALGYTPANDADVVKTSGTQNVGGDKTFTSDVRINSGGTSSLFFGSSNNGVQWNGTAVFTGWSSGGTFIAFNSGFLESSTSDTRKPGGGSWTSSSDARLKENVVNYTQGLSAITALRPVRYNYNDVTKLGVDTNHKTFTGLIAQEVQQTPLADMVAVGADNYLNLDPSELTFTLINAVKELSAQVDTLKAEVAALKGA